MGDFFNVYIFTVGSYMNKSPSKEALLVSYSLQVYIAMFRIKQSYTLSLSLMCKLYNLKQKDFCFLQFPGLNCIMVTKVTFQQFTNENSKSSNKTKLCSFVQLISASCMNHHIRTFSSSNFSYIFC